MADTLSPASDAVDGMQTELIVLSYVVSKLVAMSARNAPDPELVFQEVANSVNAIIDTWPASEPNSIMFARLEEVRATLDMFLSFARVLAAWNPPK